MAENAEATKRILIDDGLNLAEAKEEPKESKNTSESTSPADIDTKTRTKVIDTSIKDTIKELASPAENTKAAYVPIDTRPELSQANEPVKESQPTKPNQPDPASVQSIKSIGEPVASVAKSVDPDLAAFGRREVPTAPISSPLVPTIQPVSFSSTPAQPAPLINLPAQKAPLINLPDRPEPEPSFYPSTAAPPFKTSFPRRPPQLPPRYPPYIPYDDDLYEDTPHRPLPTLLRRRRVMHCFCETTEAGLDAKLQEMGLVSGKPIDGTIIKSEPMRQPDGQFPSPTDSQTAQPSSNLKKVGNFFEKVKLWLADERHPAYSYPRVHLSDNLPPPAPGIRGRIDDYGYSL